MKEEICKWYPPFWDNTCIVRWTSCGSFHFIPSIFNSKKYAATLPIVIGDIKECWKCGRKVELPPDDALIDQYPKGALLVNGESQYYPNDLDI